MAMRILGVSIHLDPCFIHLSHTAIEYLKYGWSKLRALSTNYAQDFENIVQERK